jgi:spoIIIJ-associated protein
MEDPGYIIGKQGEALEALQHVLRMILNRELELTDTLIVIDINGYREKRTKGIEQKARELAHKVRTTGKEIELPFLNSFERRVVHSIVSTIADVESESRGEGLERRLVIKPKKD